MKPIFISILILFVSLGAFAEEEEQFVSIEKEKTVVGTSGQAIFDEAFGVWMMPEEASESDRQYFLKAKQACEDYVEAQLQRVRKEAEAAGKVVVVEGRICSFSKDVNEDTGAIEIGYYVRSKEIRIATPKLSTVSDFDRLFNSECLIHFSEPLSGTESGRLLSLKPAKYSVVVIDQNNVLLSEVYAQGESRVKLRDVTKELALEYTAFGGRTAKIGCRYKEFK